MVTASAGSGLDVPNGIQKCDIILSLSGIEDQGGAWIETGAVDNPRQGSRESLSFALGL